MDAGSLDLSNVAVVLPLDPAGSAVEGYLLPGHAAPAKQALHLWLKLSGLPAASGAPLRGARLEVGAALGALLRGQEERVAARLAESTSLASFLVELRNLVDQAYLQRGLPQGGRSAAFFSSLSAELDDLGWDRVASLAPDLSSLTLSLQDRAGRQHPLTLALPEGYPADAPGASADLPAAFEPRWRAGAGLAGVVSQFEAALEQYQELWDSLDDLDARSWVVEPDRPPRGATYRRVALGGHASLALALDPARPAAFPQSCALMGSDRVVAPLRQRLHACRALWQEGRLLRENLEAVLGLELPSRSEAAAAEDVSADCAICYAYRLPPEEEGADNPGEAPDVNCDNAACAKPFHRSCLVEWLSSDGTARRSFSTLFGACPYCSAPLSVKLD